jgi:hypothetical protein
LCNLNDNSSMENAIDKKCARQIARHKWKSRLEKCKLCTRWWKFCYMVECGDIG